MRAERLGAWLDGELPATEAGDVARHVASCTDCAEEVAELRGLSSALSGLGREHAAPAFSGRVEQALRGEMAREPSRPAWRASAGQLAASVLIAGFVSASLAGWLTLQYTRTDRWIQDLASAHLRSLVQDRPYQVASADTHTVRPWFAGKVELAPDVRNFPAEGFTLLGGRIDIVERRRVPVLVYQRRQHLINVFAWPERDAPAATAFRQDGYSFRSLRHGGLVYWAVSDLEPAELERLTALLAAP